MKNVMSIAEYRATTVKKSKYRAVKTVVDGIKFDSKKEAARYSELKILEITGAISDLQLQVRFKLSVCTYVADFVYMDGGKQIVCDAKGMKTAVYNLKKKMMKHELGITILEV